MNSINYSCFEVRQFCAAFKAVCCRGCCLWEAVSTACLTYAFAKKSRCPLAGTIHIDCYLGKGPRVGKGRQAMQELRCEFWRHCGEFLLAGSICRAVFGCCAFATCSMFLGILISLLDNRPVLIDHGLEILVCSDGCRARVGPIFSLVFVCFGKYVSSLVFARLGLIDLGRGWGGSRGVFFAH